MKDELPLKLDDYESSVKRFIKSIDKGLLKVMSKMGISTYQSYCGAQIFDAVGLQSGLRRRVLHRHRTPRSKASASPKIAEETVRRHRDAFGDAPIYRDHARRRRRLCGAACAARTMSGPRRRCRALQHAVRGNSQDQLPRLRQDRSTIRASTC